MTVAEGGGKRAVWAKFQEVYIPALKANYMVWPLVQVLNFRIMPIQFQIVGSWFSQCTQSTNMIIAFCKHYWYCMDCILIPREFGRGTITYASAYLALNDFMLAVHYWGGLWSELEGILEQARRMEWLEDLRMESGVLYMIAGDRRYHCLNSDHDFLKV